MRPTGAVAVVALAMACRAKPPEAPKPDPRVATLEKQLADANAELEQLRAGDAELKALAQEEIAEIASTPR